MSNTTTTKATRVTKTKKLVPAGKDIIMCPSFMLEIDSITFKATHKKALLAMLHYSINSEEGELIQTGWEDLKRFAGINVSNTSDFESEMKEHIKQKISTNMMGKDKEFVKKQEGVVLIKDFSINNGVVRFTLANKLIEAYNKKVPYGKVEMEVVRALGSKYSINLYLMIADYGTLNNTATVRISELKKILGSEDIKDEDGVVIKERSYKEFNNLTLSRAIKELEKVAGIVLEINTSREGRKVSAVNFSIKNSRPIKPALNGNKQITIDFNPVEAEPELTKQEKMAIAELSKGKEKEEGYASYLKKKYLAKDEYTTKNVIEAIEGLKHAVEDHLQKKAFMYMHNIKQIVKSSDGTSGEFYEPKSSVRRDQDRATICYYDYDNKKESFIVHTVSQMMDLLYTSFQLDRDATIEDIDTFFEKQNKKKKFK